MTCYSPRVMTPAFPDHDCECLAKLLYVFAQDASVRELESLAAVHANVRDPQSAEISSDWQRSGEKGMPRWRSAVESDPVFAMCQRIARRAFTGALRDPTGGANRFHVISDFPDWAVGQSPTAWIGEFLFYRL